MDDGLIGADSVEEARVLHNQLQEHFHLEVSRFASETQTNQTHEVISPWRIDDFTSIRGIRCNASLDTFHPIILSLKPIEVLTKQTLMSDIAKLYDILR